MLYFATVIDWTSVLFNGFWILGCAIVLAAFSFHYWQAQLEGGRVRDQLQRPSFGQPFWLGFLLICIGLVATSTRWWEAVIWSLFVLFSLINFYKVVMQKSNE